MIRANFLDVCPGGPFGRMREINNNVEVAVRVNVTPCGGAKNQKSTTMPRPIVAQAVEHLARRGAKTFNPPCFPF